MSASKHDTNLIDLRKDEVGAVFSSNSFKPRVLVAFSSLGALVFLIFSILVEVPVGTNGFGVVKYDQSVPVLAPLDGTVITVKDIDTYRLHEAGDVIAVISRADNAATGRANREKEHIYLNDQIHEISEMLTLNTRSTKEHKVISDALINDVDMQIDKTLAALKIRMEVLEIKHNSYKVNSILEERRLLAKSEMTALNIDILTDREAIHYTQTQISALQERKKTLQLNSKTDTWDAQRRASTLRQSQKSIERELELDNDLRRTEIKMPFDGYVQNAGLLLGGSAISGNVLFYAVPKNSMLIFQADILSKNIGDIQEGDEALIEILAYPSEQFGLIAALISSIPALPLSPEINDRGVPDIVKYSIKITPDSTSLAEFVNESKLRSGMRFRVRVVNRHSSIFMLFMSPLMKQINQARS